MIYAIQLRSGKQFIKFGHAKNVAHRLSSLQSASPYKLRLLGFGDWPDVEEARIHAYIKPAANGSDPARQPIM